MQKILGIGNALVDILVTLKSQDPLKQYNLPKGSMQLVDKERSDAILEALESYDWDHAAGGSAANTIYGLARLGTGTGYMGVIGEDELGGMFVKDMIDAGVEPHMIHSSHETGRAIRSAPLPPISAPPSSFRRSICPARPIFSKDTTCSTWKGTWYRTMSW
jgi:sugar/nucleoside kinase (ribokinase family)